MKIEIVNNNIDSNEILQMAGSYAAICYSSKNFCDFKDDKEKNIRIAKHCIKSGHHSIFDHIMITLNIEGIPKIIAMMLNNIEFYNTSEKSGRYTKFPNNKIYEEWIDIFKDLISKSDKVKDHVKDDIKLVEKLAMENARYLLPIDIETNMIYSITVRQLSYLYFSMIKLHDNFQELNKDSYLFNADEKNYYKIIDHINKFINELEKIEFIKELNIEPKSGNDYLYNKINFFNSSNISNTFVRVFDDGKNNISEEYENYPYIIKYKASIATIAQLQRHRTTSINIFMKDIFDTNIDREYYIPPILNDDIKIMNKYINTLESLDYIPTAILVDIVETGTRNSYKIKSLERLCSRAQLEVCETVKKYSSAINKDTFLYNSEIKPKCKHFKCQEPCKYGVNGLDRNI